MPRSKTPDGRRVNYSVRLSEAEAGIVDEAVAASGKPRSEWLRDHVLAAAGSRASIKPARRPARRAAPVAAGSSTSLADALKASLAAAELARERARDQRDGDCDHPKSMRDAKSQTRCRCGAVNLPVPLKKGDAK